jgi:hypothetical protein
MSGNCRGSSSIVQNFGILKILLSFPSLSDQYNTGPLEVSFTIKAIKSIGMPYIIIRNKDIVKSNNLFIITKTCLSPRRQVAKGSAQKNILSI